MLHYYETTAAILTFKGFIKYTNKAIDNPHLFYEFTNMLITLQKYLNI